MLDAVLTAFGQIFGCPCAMGVVPQNLLWVLFGATMGLALGLIPGLGGLVGLSLLLPFTFDMDTTAAVATAIGMLATLNTSDTIPAVLIGLPGGNSAQATVIDGYPMAKAGLAARALGAAYMASMIGGIFGALVLAVSVPVLRPIVLAFGAPEFLMIALLGISTVAVLSGKAPVKGLIVALLGMTAGMVGADPQTGVARWTFGERYLFDGLMVVPITLGLFAIPEIVDLAARRRSIARADVASIGSGLTDGIRDTLRHWFLVLRSSAVGVWAGVLPGAASTAGAWLAYAHAAQSEKGARETFGKGDVRGVIAPEAANNSTEGGDLVPTVAFGVPGGAAMALLLSIFLVQGITPGPEMLTTNLPVTYTLVWSLVIANVFGTAACLLLGRYFAKITQVRPDVLFPFVVGVVVVAALQATRQFADLVVLLLAAVLGWVMKRLGWPRPPFILAFILSPIIENYYFISTERYGASFLGRPIVIGVGILIVWMIIHQSVLGRRRNRDQDNVAR